MQPLPQERRILLAGATGYIGRAVAAELCTRGHDVVAIVRDGAGHAADGVSRGLPDSCSVVVAELTGRESTEAAFAGLRVDAAVSCLASRSGVPDDAWRVDYQANANFLAAARKAGAGHFLLLSALCVQKPRLAFQRAKLAFEVELAEADLDHTIVRPTAFFKSLGGQVARVRQGKPFLVFGDGRDTACKPIGAGDLARFMANCLDDPAARDRILPIGGPGPAITPREQGELLCSLAGRPSRIRSVPRGLFTAALFALAPLSRVSRAAAAKAELARIGRYYASESMLVWDEQAERYDADATPEFGAETLEDFYRRVLAEGMTGHELGAHKLF